jgi:hypothetical protein
LPNFAKGNRKRSATESRALITWKHGQHTLRAATDDMRTLDQAPRPCVQGIQIALPSECWTSFKSPIQPAHQSNEDKEQEDLCAEKPSHRSMMWCSESINKWMECFNKEDLCSESLGGAAHSKDYLAAPHVHRYQKCCRRPLRFDLGQKARCIPRDCKRTCQTTSLQNHQISTSHEMSRYWPAMAPTVSASPRKLTASHHKQPQVQSKCLALSGHAVLPYERLATWGHRSWAANSSYGMLWVHDPSSTMGWLVEPPIGSSLRFQTIHFLRFILSQTFA